MTKSPGEMLQFVAAGTLSCLKHTACVLKWHKLFLGGNMLHCPLVQFIQGLNSAFCPH